MKEVEFTPENIEKAFYNSYRLITHKIDFLELVIESVDDSMPTLLVHDPDNDLSIEDINNVIIYFEQQERYELCAELKEELDKIIN